MRLHVVGTLLNSVGARTRIEVLRTPMPRMFPSAGNRAQLLFLHTE